MSGSTKGLLGSVVLSELPTETLLRIITKTGSTYHLMVLDLKKSLVIFQGGSSSTFQKPRVCSYLAPKDEAAQSGAINCGFSMYLRSETDQQEILTSSVVEFDRIEDVFVLEEFRSAAEQWAFRVSGDGGTVVRDARSDTEK